MHNKTTAVEFRITKRETNKRGDRVGVTYLLRSDLTAKRPGRRSTLSLEQYRETVGRCDVGPLEMIP